MLNIKNNPPPHVTVDNKKNVPLVANVLQRMFVFKQPMTFWVRWTTLKTDFTIIKHLFTRDLAQLARAVEYTDGISAEE